MRNIYFDHSSTTPIDPQVLKAMQPYLTAEFGNASSLHTFGQKARAGVERAREQVAEFLNCESKEIIFTSGATESNNLAILGLARRLRNLNSKRKLHLITSSIEHPAVLEPCRELEKEGVAVTYLPVTKKGLVRPEDVRRALRPETFLVSIMYVNNEIGTIQPIREISKIIKEERKRKCGKTEACLPGAPLYFHTDAVQAVNYCNCKVDWLGVDLLSLSAHKIYGPKGVGALYVRGGTPLLPLQYGGHQERGLRSGTENVSGIVGLGKAVELLSEKFKMKSEKLRIKKLRDKLVKEVLRKIPDVILNGDLEQRVPSNASFCFKNVEGESILLILDMKGIAVSTGSACASGSLEPSHVLLALGIKPELAHGSLRVTLGKFTTEKEINYFLKILPGVISRLRKISPIK